MPAISSDVQVQKSPNSTTQQRANSLLLPLTASSKPPLMLLHEYCQKRQLRLQLQESSQGGGLFTFKAMLQNLLDGSLHYAGTGSGSTKKAAQHEAATAAVQNLGAQPTEAALLNLLMSMKKAPSQEMTQLQLNDEGPQEVATAENKLDDGEVGNAEARKDSEAETSTRAELEATVSLLCTSPRALPGASASANPSVSMDPGALLFPSSRPTVYAHQSNILICMEDCPRCQALVEKHQQSGLLKTPVSLLAELSLLLFAQDMGLTYMSQEEEVAVDAGAPSLKRCTTNLYRQDAVVTSAIGTGISKSLAKHHAAARVVEWILEQQHQHEQTGLITAVPWAPEMAHKFSRVTKLLMERGNRMKNPATLLNELCTVKLMTVSYTDLPQPSPGTFARSGQVKDAQGVVLASSSGSTGCRNKKIAKQLAAAELLEQLLAIKLQNGSVPPALEEPPSPGSEALQPMPSQSIPAASLKETELPSLAEQVHAPQPPPPAVQVQVSQPPAPAVQVQVPQPPSPAEQVQVSQPPSPAVQVQVPQSPSPAVQVHVRQPPSPAVQVQVPQPPSPAVQVQVPQPPSPAVQVQVPQPPSPAVQVQPTLTEQTGLITAVPWAPEMAHKFSRVTKLLMEPGNRTKNPATLLNELCMAKSMTTSYADLPQPSPGTFACSGQVKDAQGVVLASSSGSIGGRNKKTAKQLVTAELLEQLLAIKLQNESGSVTEEGRQQGASGGRTAADGPPTQHEELQSERLLQDNSETCSGPELGAGPGPSSRSPAGAGPKAQGIPNQPEQPNATDSPHSRSLAVADAPQSNAPGACVPPALEETPSPGRQALQPMPSQSIPAAPLKETELPALAEQIQGLQLPTPAEQSWVITAVPWAPEMAHKFSRVTNLLMEPGNRTKNPAALLNELCMAKSMTTSYADLPQPSPGTFACSGQVKDAQGVVLASSSGSTGGRNKKIAKQLAAAELLEQLLAIKLQNESGSGTEEGRQQGPSGDRTAADGPPAQGVELQPGAPSSGSPAGAAPQPPSTAEEAQVLQSTSLAEEAQMLQPPSLAEQVQAPQPPSPAEQVQVQQPHSLAEPVQVQQPPSPAEQVQVPQPPSPAEQVQVPQPPPPAVQVQVPQPSCPAEQVQDQPPSSAEQVEVPQPPWIAEDVQVPQPSSAMGPLGRLSMLDGGRRDGEVLSSLMQRFMQGQSAMQASQLPQMQLQTTQDFLFGTDDPASSKRLFSGTRPPRSTDTEANVPSPILESAAAAPPLWAQRCPQSHDLMLEINQNRKLAKSVISVLNEYTALQQQQVKYQEKEVDDALRPPQLPLFTIQAHVEDIYTRVAVLRPTSGTGNSKKDAKDMAAAMLLELLLVERQVEKSAFMTSGKRKLP